MASKKKSARGSKTEFVMSLPLDVPAKDVVAKAKKAGITITSGHVSNIRSVAKSKAKPKLGRPKGSTNSTNKIKGQRRPGRPKGSSSSSSTRASSSSAERSFRQHVIELGVGRAEELIDQVKRTIRVMIDSM